MEKKPVRILNGPDLEKILPQDSRMKIEHLCIGMSKENFTYIRTNSQGGGTGGTSVKVYDFGFAAENLSNVRMSVQFTITKLDSDGYTVDHIYVGATLNPGEKRREWAGLSHTVDNKLKSYLIDEISIGPELKDGYGKFSPSATAYPKESIYDIFGLKTHPIASGRLDKGCAIALIVAVAVVVGLPLMYFVGVNVLALILRIFMRH